MGICRPCSLHLGMLNVWTWQSHQTWLREFQSLPVLPVSSPAVQLQASLPFIGSFLPLVSHPVVCPLALSPSLSGRDTWQTVTPLSLPPLLPPIPDPIFHLPSRAFLVVCPSSEEAGFLGELRRKDCFSCVYRETSRSHRIGLAG